MEYTVIRRKNRKNLRIEVKITGEVIVRSSPYTSMEKIDAFVNKNLEWIKKVQQEYSKQYHYRRIVTKAERKQMKNDALPAMEVLTEKYAGIMGVSPKSVKITEAEKRWGSCSSKDTICYSYRVWPLSQRCKEYIVIHELAHLREFNHSKDFYKLISRYMPDYKEAERELDGYYIHME